MTRMPAKSRTWTALEAAGFTPCMAKTIRVSRARRRGRRASSLAADRGFLSAYRQTDLTKHLEFAKKPFYLQTVCQ